MNHCGFTLFSTEDASGVMNVKYVCSGFLCHVYGLISVSLWLFLGF